MVNRINREKDKLGCILCWVLSLGSKRKEWWSEKISQFQQRAHRVCACPLQGRLWYSPIFACTTDGVRRCNSLLDWLKLTPFLSLPIKYSIILKKVSLVLRKFNYEESGNKLQSLFPSITMYIFDTTYDSQTSLIQIYWQRENRVNWWKMWISGDIL